MHIVMTLSGEGQRFLQAGYSVPKFLLEIEGVPIIEHLVRLFPGEKRFTFICRPDSLEKTNLRELLQKIAPEGKIRPIPPHKKGPVYSVVQILETLEDHEEVLINYCDFGMVWNYSDFLLMLQRNTPDGAIVAYRGFHPHLPGTTNYAFLRSEGSCFLEAREKRPFTSDPFQEYISSGTYYFKKGMWVKQYFPALLKTDADIHGEYYVSLVYNLMQHDQHKTLIYEIPYMLQWGTPRDLEAYRFWSDYFSKKGSLKTQTLFEPNTRLSENRIQVSWGKSAVLWSPQAFEVFWNHTQADFVVLCFRSKIQTAFPIVEPHLVLEIGSINTIQFLSPQAFTEIPLQKWVDIKVWFFRRSPKILSILSEFSSFHVSQDPSFFYTLGQFMLKNELKGATFEVDFYCPLGTSELTQTFDYWQKVFHP